MTVTIHAHSHEHTASHSPAHTAQTELSSDTSIVVSAEFSVAAPDTRRLANKLEGTLERLSAWVEQQGGVIGHIKAFIEPENNAENSVITFSTVGTAVNRHGALKLNIGVTSIVFGVSQIALRMQTELLIANLLKAMGITSIEFVDCDHDNHN